MKLVRYQFVSLKSYKVLFTAALITPIPYAWFGDQWKTDRVPMCGRCSAGAWLESMAFDVQIVNICVDWKVWYTQFNDWVNSVHLHNFQFTNAERSRKVAHTANLMLSFARGCGARCIRCPKFIHCIHHGHDPTISTINEQWRTFNCIRLHVCEYEACEACEVVCESINISRMNERLLQFGFVQVNHCTTVLRLVVACFTHCP